MGKGKVEDVILRQQKIVDIEESLKKKGEIITRAKIIEELHKAGFPSASLSTLYRDRVALARNNRFVRDLAESTYSKYVGDIFERMETLQEQVDNWHKNPPKITKQKVEPIGLYPKGHKQAGQPMFKIIETTVETMNPVTISQFDLRIQETKLGALKGDIVDTSVALISEEFDKLQQENEALERAKKKLEEEKASATSS